ncbi:hypothetical protein [Methylogaea oryzae]|uniref:hypothetical protein n=1 Tax=Methylogaea oryzae TaxID=1295382 RepID=UPI0026E57C1E|nr:hypothetical protein [Methylogaea oryzae]
MSDSMRGRPWLMPSSVTVRLRAASCLTSASVFQAMPLPPLPIFVINGPRAVNIL